MHTQQCIVCILQRLVKLRELDSSFTAPHRRLTSEMKKACLGRTVQKVPHKAGYSKVQKKGLLMAKDLKERVHFCKKVKDSKEGAVLCTTLGPLLVQIYPKL